MNAYRLTEERIASYARHLRLEEKSPGTVEKYLRDIRAFAVWLDRRPVSKELATAWKSHLLEQGYAPVTINSMLCTERIVQISGLERVSGKVFEDTTPLVPGHKSGINKG